MSQSIEKEVEKFEKQIDQWRCEYNNIDFVFNKQLKDVEWEKIQYLVVADNPGKKENENEEYLFSDATSHHSRSGVISKKIFDFLGISGKYIVLNKCPIFTSQTEGLKSVDLDILKETQEYMVEFIYKIHKELNCKVYIFGFGGCYDYEKGWLAKKTGGEYYAGQILSEFFEKLKLKYKGKSCVDKIYIMKHFSYWNIFTDLTFIEISDSKESKELQLCSKVTLKKLKEKDILSSELMDALESLGYKDELFV